MSGLSSLSLPQRRGSRGRVWRISLAPEHKTVLILYEIEKGAAEPSHGCKDNKENSICLGRDDRGCKTSATGAKTCESCADSWGTEEHPASYQMGEMGKG